MKRATLKGYMAAPAPAALSPGRFPGAKGQEGVWQRIIGQMPPHAVYVEPFLGTGQIFRRKRPAESSIVIDANPAAIAALGEIAGVRRIVGDALKLLPDLLAWLPPDAVIYCDPPYLLSTRQGRLHYDHEPEAGDPDWHAKLLKVLKPARCRVLLSGYPSELYSWQLREWRCLEYTAMTRGGKRRECLWCNYPEPACLHDWRFAGFNYRQRFGMKRFVARWLARIEAMPPRRAGYVMHELQNAIVQRHGRSGDPLTPPLAMAATTSTSAANGSSPH